MKSLKELYRIGNGPSSSHTMGPKKAAEMFLERVPQAARYVVTLYGSLAATGKGHLTDTAILKVLEPHAPTTVEWLPRTFLPFHPNAMKLEAFSAVGSLIDSWTVYSIGGGALSDGNAIVGLSEETQKDIYPMTTISEIQAWCEQNGRTYWEYVEMHEDPDIWDHLSEVWSVMKAAVRNGLDNEGVLPGPLNLQRKAASYFIKAKGYKASLQSRGLVFAYALAVSEENAAGGRIVTAPTCGSCGVLPAILYHLEETRNFSETRILRALATAGLFGNVVKQNASISGAEVGCQGEVGVACSMAAARLAALWRQYGTDRVCSRDGTGTSPGNDLRPGLWPGAGSLYRTECIRSCPCTRRQPLLFVYRRQPPGVVRPCGGGDETDRP